MTSFTAESAMTSFTDSLLVPVSLAAQGARRATEAVNETGGQASSEPVITLVNGHSVHHHAESLPSYVNGCDHIFVHCFRGQTEFLAEDVQQTIAANETHQVIKTAAWLGQRMPWSQRRFRTSNSDRAQSHLRGASLQLGIAISGVVLLFKEQRLVAQLIHVFQSQPSEQAAAVVI